MKRVVLVFFLSWGRSVCEGASPRRRRSSARRLGCVSLQTMAESPAASGRVGQQDVLSAPGMKDTSNMVRVFISSAFAGQNLST